MSRVVSVLVVVAALATAGCGIERSIRYAPPLDQPTPSDFVPIRRAWTRGASVVPVSGLENVLTVTATCLSPEFRTAYVARYSRDYRLGPRERDDLLRLQQTTGQRELQFFVTAFAGTEFRDADLSDPDRGWRVLLVTPRGRWAHTSLQKIRRPTAVQKAYFPHIHPQRMVFLVGFPPVVDRNDRWMRLSIVSARGQAELEWAFSD